MRTADLNKKLDLLMDVELEYRKRQKENPEISKSQIISDIFNYDRSRYYQVRREYNKVIEKLYGSVEKMIDIVERGEKSKDDVKKEIIAALSMQQAEEVQESEGRKGEAKSSEGVLVRIRQDLKATSEKSEKETGIEEKTKIEKESWFKRYKWVIFIGIGIGIAFIVSIVLMNSGKKLEKKETTAEVTTTGVHNRYVGLGLPPEF